MTDIAPGHIAARAEFSFVRYAAVWEDADVLCEALAPCAAGGRLLSVASAGDNALALLTLDPAEVVAVDLSLPQLACVEIRIAAFRHLDDNELLRFLGAQGAGDEAEHGFRLLTYSRLRPDLTEDAQAFWDTHPDEMGGGLMHAGKFERYLRAFRRFVLPLVHSGNTLRSLLAPRSPDERERFYRERWDTWRWRALFRVFFSRAVMGRVGRDPAFFDQVTGAVAPRILERTRYALTALPAHSNPYLGYIMTGTYPDGALPRYLRPEHTRVIRERLDRVRLVQGSIPEACDGPFDGFSLSDIFEYQTPEQHERCYAGLVDRASPGARLVYWNMLAPRSRPGSEAARVRALPDVAAQLHARDQAWFYQALHVDEVLEDQP